MRRQPIRQVNPRQPILNPNVVGWFYGLRFI
jgi:hypothetical protein